MGETNRILILRALDLPHSIPTQVSHHQLVQLTASVFPSATEPSTMRDSGTPLLPTSSSHMVHWEPRPRVQNLPLPPVPLQPPLLTASPSYQLQVCVCELTRNRGTQAFLSAVMKPFNHIQIGYCSGGK